MVRALRRVAPRLRIAGGIDPTTLSRDPEVVRSYADDPFVYRRITVSFASELMDAIVRTAGGAMQVQVPMLLLHGEADRLCAARGSRSFHGQLRGGGHRLRVYPQLRHEIFNEPEQEQVFEDVLAWLLERTT
jgi:alpha-beta hydrolase superfamily lysophospholipase